jgi:hypothetical protein
MLDKNLKEAFIAAKGEAEPDIPRLRSLLRLYSELHLVGVVGIPPRAQLNEADLSSYINGGIVLKLLNMLVRVK